MAVALALAGSALYVFYLFIYRPVFTSVPPTVPEAAFDVRLYKNVLNGINSNGSDLRNELDQKLPNPF